MRADHRVGQRPLIIGLSAIGLEGYLRRGSRSAPPPGNHRRSHLIVGLLSREIGSRTWPFSPANTRSPLRQFHRDQSVFPSLRSFRSCPFCRSLAEARCIVDQIAQLTLTRLLTMIGNAMKEIRTAAIDTIRPLLRALATRDEARQ
jgi:hypothetical protein